MYSFPLAMNTTIPFTGFACFISMDIASGRSLPVVYWPLGFRTQAIPSSMPPSAAKAGAIDATASPTATKVPFTIDIVLSLQFRGHGRESPLQKRPTPDEPDTAHTDVFAPEKAHVT